ncbi:MAG: cytochrome c biogenesis protein CcsA [Burkholderiaceae bacterium]|jgi:ABC-type uncharacterized transport system permease subunit
MLILLYAVVSIGYLVLAVWAWQSALARTGSTALLAAPAPISASARAFGLLERLCLFTVWVLHLWLLGLDFRGPEGIRFGFASALSATMWVAVAVFWVESLYYALSSMRLLILPIAGLCALLPLWFPGTSALTAANATRNPAFDAHIVVALASYSLLTIAALHALLMAALDRWLHRTEMSDRHRQGLWDHLEGAILGQLPPLLTMESLLFRLVALGFALLTLTVLTGIVFHEALFGSPLTFDHKTVFTLISWFIFGALLFGRRLYGWRGRVALRWTLSGFVAMFLAYAGSRFVLEVVLHRI